MSRQTSLTGHERVLADHELIVSKTDLKGRMTYCNDVFLSFAGYAETECLGQPHSMIRHPDMPRAVFALLWQTIERGDEIFAYVVNRSKNGDHYWVNAHVTPSRNGAGQIIGFHSNRRAPDRAVLTGTIQPLYARLLEIERAHPNRKDGMHAATADLHAILASRGLAYDEFIATLAGKPAATLGRAA